MRRVATKEDIELWYGMIWHRKCRTDEIERHLKWRTPFSRLINWLIDNTPSTKEFIGWQSSFPNFRVTAYFLDPTYKRYWKRDHWGLDTVVRDGLTKDRLVLPIGQGLCTHTGFDTGSKWSRRNSYGNYVKIRHNKKYRSLYAHLHRIDVVPGWFVPKTRALGSADNTGWSNGDHLHQELYKKVWWGWQKIDPLPFILKGGE